MPIYLGAAVSRTISSIGQEKNILFVSCNSLKKNRVTRSVKKIKIIFWSKMCVLCMFYVDYDLGGRKQL